MTQISWLIALIPAFPLAGFLLNVFLVRGERANGTVASLSIVAAFITTVVAVINLAAWRKNHGSLPLPSGTG